MNRTRDYYRHQRKRVINRKRKIIHSQDDYWYVPHDGMLSKGKIHCSCPMCRRKSYDEAKMQDLHSTVGDLDMLEDVSDEFYVAKTVNKIKNRTARIKLFI